jgi:glycosyltransferase involved in cell wall biosynthesis
MTDFRPCVVIPTYDNPRTIRAVVERVRLHLPDLIVVDDGSGPEGREAVAALGAEGLAQVHRRDRNGGKGAAVKDGFRLARERGFTHALQIDADGQHDDRQVTEFLAAARRQPTALVLGEPVFDASAPAVRLRARRISRFWTDLETGGRVIKDPLCGFRVYPLGAVARLGAMGDWMDFDVEVAVRLVWGGCPVVNVPTRVRYVAAADGGVSHFHMVSDNLRISWCHTRLCAGALWRVLLGWLR